MITSVGTFNHTPQNQNPTLTHLSLELMAMVSTSALMIQRYTLKKMGNLISSADIITVTVYSYWPVTAKGQRHMEGVEKVDTEELY